MKKLFVPLALFTTVLVSCKKDKDESVAITKENLAGNYKVVTFTFKVNGVPVADERQACEKDDIIHLMANNQYQVEDAGVVCDPAGGDAGTWDLQGTVLTSDADFSGNIVSFNGKDLVIENSGSSQGITWSYNVVLKKQ